MSDTYWFSIAIACFFLFLAGFIKNRTKRTYANKNSVAIGRDNLGIINQHINAKNSSLFGQIWEILCGVATLVSLGVALW